MVKLEFRYVHRTDNGRGNIYYNFRKKDCQRKRLPGKPGSKEFMQVYAECLENAAPQGLAEKGKIKPGSTTALVRAYYRSTAFLSLNEDSTQQSYRRILDRFCQDYGDNPVNRLESKHIKAILAAKHKTPAAANQLLKRLRQLMRFAVEEGLIKIDPTIGVRRIKYRTKPIHTWTEQEAIKFGRTHPKGTMANLAFVIMSNTGLRKSDAVRLGRNHVVEHAIVFTAQKKTGVPVMIPILPPLAEALANIQDRMIFILNSHGRPFTAKGFGNWMRQRCDEAGLPECSSHGLRKLIATRLAENGCTENEISAILGWTNNSQASLYTKSANREKLAQRAMRAIS